MTDREKGFAGTGSSPSSVKAQAKTCFTGLAPPALDRSFGHPEAPACGNPHCIFCGKHSFAESEPRFYFQGARGGDKNCPFIPFG